MKKRRTWADPGEVAALQKWALRVRATALAKEILQACGYFQGLAKEHHELQWQGLPRPWRREVEKWALELLLLAQQHSDAQDANGGDLSGAVEAHNLRGRDRRLQRVTKQLQFAVRENAVVKTCLVSGSPSVNALEATPSGPRKKQWWLGDVTICCSYPVARNQQGAPLLSLEGIPVAEVGAWEVNLRALRAGEPKKTPRYQQPPEAWQVLEDPDCRARDEKGIPLGYLQWPKLVRERWAEAELGRKERAPTQRYRQEREDAERREREAASVGLLPEEYQEMQREVRERWLAEVRYWERLNEWALTVAKQGSHAERARAVGAKLGARNWRAWLPPGELRAYDAWLKQQPGWLSPQAWLRREAEQEGTKRRTK